MYSIGIHSADICRRVSLSKFTLLVTQLSQSTSAVAVGFSAHTISKKCNRTNTDDEFDSTIFSNAKTCPRLSAFFSFHSVCLRRTSKSFLAPKQFRVYCTPRNSDVWSISNLLSWSYVLCLHNFSTDIKMDQIRRASVRLVAGKGNQLKTLTSLILIL